MLTELKSSTGPAAPETSPTESERAQLVSFMVNERSYAVEILSVREIRQPSYLTHLPNQPPHVRGVLNLRGAIIPVHDLGSRFGGSLIEVADLTVIIIVQVEERVLGMMVDAVLDILTMDRAEIRPMPVGSELPLVGGLYEGEDGTITVLNLHELFAVDQYDEAMRA